MPPNTGGGGGYPHVATHLFSCFFDTLVFEDQFANGSMIEMYGMVGPTFG